MKLSLIVAMDRNGLIGKDGGLPWGRVPEDMRHFREMTEGRDVVAGRKTTDTLPNLGGRRVWMLSDAWQAIDWETVFDVCGSPREFVMALDERRASSAFVIGGAQTYAAFRDLVTEAHVTLIDGEYAGDTYFPFQLFGNSEWLPLAEPRTLAPGVVYHHLGRA